MINQKSVTLLADTGASVVVVPEKIAKKIGLRSGKPMQFRTAGGLVTNYATTLDNLTIGPIQIRNVEAVINPSMHEDFALLGMNVLALLHMTQQREKTAASGLQTQNDGQHQERHENSNRQQHCRLHLLALVQQSPEAEYQPDGRKEKCRDDQAGHRWPAPALAGQRQQAAWRIDRATAAGAYNRFVLNFFSAKTTIHLQPRLSGSTD